MESAAKTVPWVAVCSDTASMETAEVALLVEDEAEFARHVRHAIQDAAPELPVQHCSTAAAALALLAQPHCRVALALVDLGLPDGSGIEVIDVLRSRFPDIPILVVSVLSGQHHVLAAIRAGARGYVLKSDSGLALADSIRSARAGIYPLSARLARHLFHRVLGDTGAQPADSPIPELSPRETEMLRLFSLGRSYAEVAGLMGIGVSTVQSHVRNVYRKLDVHSQLQAVRKAQLHGLLDTAPALPGD